MVVTMTSLELKVESIKGTLSAGEQRVAQYFLNNPQNVFHLPISKLASECEVSQVIWVRFCKALGYSGLKEFKKVLFNELNTAPKDDTTSYDLTHFTDIKDHCGANEIAQTVMKSSVSAIQNTVQLMKFDALTEIAQRITKAPCVRLFGIGSSGIVAQDFAQKLQRIEKFAFYFADFHLQLTSAVNMKKEDVAIFISNSGATTEIKELFDIAKKSGCTTISLTKYGSNSIADGADFNLFTSSPEIYHRSGAMSSRIAQLAVLDILFTCIANSDYNNIEKSLKLSHDVCMTHRQ